MAVNCIIKCNFLEKNKSFHLSFRYNKQTFALQKQRPATADFVPNNSLSKGFKSKDTIFRTLYQQLHQPKASSATKWLESLLSHKLDCPISR